MRATLLVAVAASIGACGLRELAESCPDEPVVLPAPLQRLSVEDYERTLRVLVGDEVVETVRPLLAALPADIAEEEGFFARQDQRLTQRHIDQTYAVADAIAQRAAADGAVRAIAGHACEATITDDCLDTFVPTFLERALRRPPTSDEQADARALVAEFTGADRVHALVFTTLMKPEVLYHFENQGTSRHGTVTLTAHELASRLSYHFWGEPPDQALLEAAVNGDLDDEAGLAEQVARLFADPRAQRTLDAYFTEWLHLERGNYVSSPRLDVLAPDLELDGLAAEMRQEVLDLVQHTLAQGGSWHDVLTSTDSFARSERLAALYGVPAWDGLTAPPSLPADQRAGLLTRAGLLATMDGSTNPFRRGVFVRRSMLCQDVPAPPADLPPSALVPPDPVAGATTRDAFAAKVDSEDCAMCHTLFSPLGYGLEGYDGLGRYRVEEHLVSDVGEDLGVSAVDTEIETWIDGSGTTRFADGVALAHAIADSPDSSWCMSRQYFRYTARREDEGRDSCRVQSWSARLDAGQPLGDWMQEIALDPTFRQRRLED